MACGVSSGDRVAIWSGTRWEWAIADLAIMGMGAVTVPVYRNIALEHAAFIINDSGSEVLLCENREVVEQWLRIRSACPGVRVVIQMDEVDRAIPGGEAISWTDFLAKGSPRLAAEPDLYTTLVDQRTLRDVASIVYTSGTTGQPKGAVLAHEQLMSAFVDVHELDLTEGDVSLTFLPFAHIAGRTEHFGHVYIGFCMGYAESIERIKDNLQDVRPTFMASVPRMFEKVYDTAVAKASVNPVRHAIFRWAVRVGNQVSEARSAMRPPPLRTRVTYPIARKLVFDRLARALGGRLRFAISGGAPLSVEILRFFHAAGFPILEAYGLTETTAAVFMNTVREFRFGYAGQAIGDVEIRLADDGEILLRSAQVMRGYHNNPAATGDVLSDDGWFATGDIGEMDGTFLRITDRKKDLIKTAGGKYIAPQRIEGLLKLSRYVANVLVHGDTRRFVVALMTPNLEELRKFAAAQHLQADDPARLLAEPKVRALYQAAVDAANAQLAGYEQIKNFEVLPHDFTIETGELTPSMKVRRKVCDEKYADVIERLYRTV